MITDFFVQTLAVLIQTTKKICQKFLLDANASSASAWGRPWLSPSKHRITAAM